MGENKCRTNYEGDKGPDRQTVRVVHLSSGHDADDARIYWKECLSLAEAGYDVRFVVPTDQPSRYTNPYTAVKMVFVPLCSSRVGRLTISPLAVLLAGLRQNADLYHFHDPELLLAGFLLRLLRKRVIYDVHEDLPRDILVKPWLPRPIRRLMAGAAAAAEWLAGKTLSGFVAATPVIASRFPATRTALVQNFARAAEFTPRRALFPEDAPVIAYVGGITIQRCAVEMIQAMNKLDQFPEARLAIAGTIAPPDLAVDLRALPGWSRVDFRGRLPREGVRAVLGQARIGLALFHPLQPYIESQPVKLFEYMAAGIPVIAANFPLFRDILETKGCGICVPPRDVDAIAAAMQYLLKNPGEAHAMGMRGRSLMMKSYSWESEARALLGLYDDIFERARPMQTMKKSRP